MDYAKSAVEMDDAELRATVERLRAMVSALWALVQTQAHNIHEGVADGIAQGIHPEDFTTMYEGLRDDCREHETTGPYKDGLLWVADTLDEAIKNGRASGQSQPSGAAP